MKYYHFINKVVNWFIFCLEWYLNENPNDDEIRAIDNSLNNYYIVIG